MSSDLITPENLSKELLESIYDSAFFETSWDDDGDLVIKDQIRCLVMPNEEKNRIQLVSLFGFAPRSRMSKRLECVNKINSEYIMVTAVAGANDTLQFKYDIYVEGGITKKNLVLATKRFLSIPVPATAEHGGNLVE